MLNKGSDNFYLFILSYGHLDLLTSMYSYQDATKENMHKPFGQNFNNWNHFFLLYPDTDNNIMNNTNEYKLIKRKDKT